MRYSYILEGYDKEWRDMWENQIRYENLPLGEYIFKVLPSAEISCLRKPLLYSNLQ